MREEALLQSLSDSSLRQEDFAELTAKLPSDARFVQTESWIALAKDPGQDAWRRLAACLVVLEHGLSFPIPHDDFVTGVIRPMGIREDQIREVQMAQFLPIERKEGERVFVADTAIRTSIGPASIYFTVDSSKGEVQRAALYPSET